MSKPKLRITGESRTVDIDSIEGNPWNPNVQSEFKFEQTKAVIEEFGFLDPCTVRQGREKGKLFKKPQIIDGEHRWKAAEELGLKQVLILDVGRMSDAKAKVLTDIMNNLRGENDPMKWAEMVESVKDHDPDLLQFLPYQTDELEAMLESAQVDWGQFESTGNAGKDGDELFKKFSVSLSTADADRVADLMRKVKAAHKLDSDTAAFVVILDGFEAHRAAQADRAADVTPSPPKAPAKRKRSRKPKAA